MRSLELATFELLRQIDRKPIANAEKRCGGATRRGGSCRQADHSIDRRAPDR
jgi:hypothetical protein